MKLEEIKPGSVLWNHWTYSIMGRDTGESSNYFIVTEVLPVEEGGPKNPGKSIQCQTIAFGDSREKTNKFTEEEIKKGHLKFATKKELQKEMLAQKNSIEKKILDHKHKISELELDLSDVDGKFKEFIEKAI